MTPSALREIMDLASRPGILSFAVGLPAADLFPARELSAAAARVLASDGQALQYAVPYQPLRRQVVELMSMRGVSCREEQVFLTSGAQQGMDLLSRLLLAPGGRVILERAVYEGLQLAVRRLAPEILTVPTDSATGIDVDAVEALLATGAVPAFLYLITDGHNPLGVSISRDKRTRLAELARRHQLPIVEDDAYGFLHFDENPPPPLRALDAEWVCYLGSFSKILAPGLRAGWMVVAEPLIPRLSALKHAVDLDTPSFSHRVISEYLAAEDFPRHLERLRVEYRRRRDATLSALERHLSGRARWNRPSGGMFVWVELSPAIDAVRLLATAVERFSLAFSPGQAFAVAGTDHARHCLRLAFGNLQPAQIAEGIERLAALVQSAAH